MEFSVALSGGNALGAFQAGALCLLLERGHQVSVVAGTSIGAVNAVLLAAPKSGDSAQALRAFWNDVAQNIFTVVPGQQETIAAMLTALFGRPTLGFSYAGTFPAMLMARNSLQSAEPLAVTLERLVDFKKLSQDGVRCILGSTALDPDEPHAFDSVKDELRPEHVLASAALPVLYPPVVIDGRAYVDGGLSANLPLEHLFELEDLPSICLSLDLLSLGGPTPSSIDAAAERLQSQMFAFQSQRILANVARSAKTVRVIHASYQPAEREGAGKAMDFSRQSIQKRWTHGAEAMNRMLDRVAIKRSGEGTSIEHI